MDIFLFNMFLYKCPIFDWHTFYEMDILLFSRFLYKCSIFDWHTCILVNYFYIVHLTIFTVIRLSWVPIFFMIFKTGWKKVYKENTRGNTLFIITVRGQSHQDLQVVGMIIAVLKTDDMLLDMTGERTLYIYYV